MSRQEQSTARAYVAQFGLNGKALGIFLAGLVFTVLVIMLPGILVPIRVTGMLVFGVGGLAFLLFACLKSGIAFRADEQGITLGNPHGGRRKPASNVPWSSIAEVVLFRQDAGTASIPHVGLRLRRTAAGVAPHVTDDMIAHSRSISGWQLDEEMLAHVITVHAPHVRFVRTTDDRAHTIHESPRGEGPLARQRRLLIHADFRSNESVTLSNGDSSLDNYRSGGPGLRFFSRMWNLLVAATMGPAGLIGLAVILSGKSEFSWWGAPLGVAFFMAFFYFALYHLAGWRCMRRHEKSNR